MKAETNKPYQHKVILSEEEIEQIVYNNPFYKGVLEALKSDHKEFCGMVLCLKRMAGYSLFMQVWDKILREKENNKTD